MGTLLLVAVTIGAAWAARSLNYDFSPQALYAAAGSDAVAYWEAFGDEFGHEDALVLMVLEAKGDRDVLTPEALSWMRRTAAAASSVPDVAGVYSAATLPLFWGDDQSTAVSPEQSEGFRTWIQSATLLDGLLVSRNRRRATTIAGMRPAVRSVARMRPALQALRATVGAVTPPQGYRVRWAGMPVVREHIVQDLNHEQRTMLPLAAVMFLLIMWWSLGTLRGALLPLLAVGMGMVWTGGALAMLGEQLNIVDNMMPIVLLVIGAANGIHIVHRYGEEVRRTPTDVAAARARTLRRMGKACLFTYATTAVGFLSLVLARFDALRAVGWHMALGLMLVYASTMALMALHLDALDAPTRRRGIGRLLSALGDAVTARPWPAIVLAIALLGASVWAASRVPVRTSMLEMYEHDHAVHETARMVEEELGGTLTVDVSLAAPRETLLAPDTLARVDAFTHAARNESAVALARSFVDLHSVLHARLLGETAPGARTPEQVEQVDTLARSLNATIRYNRFMNADATRGRVMLRVRDGGSDALATLSTSLQERLDGSGLSEAGVTTRLTGLGHFYGQALTGFIREMLRSLLGAAGVVLLLIVVLFRSVRMGLLAALPNITPLVLTVGYMALRGYELNRASAIVFAVGLGVAVDDTIHFLVRFREESAHGTSARRSVRRTMQTAGQAMVITTVLMVVGLSFVYTSDFMPTRRFAELTSVMMVAALIGDLCLLPALLVTFRGPRRATPR